MENLFEFIKSHTFKREALTLPINGKEENWDYLTIYDKDGKIVARSQRHHFEGTIFLIYEGLTFMCEPLAKNYGENQIFVSIESIKSSYQS